MVMKWLVPESSGRYVNRMTNEALHKGGPRDPVTGQGGHPSARQPEETLTPGLLSGPARWLC